MAKTFEDNIARLEEIVTALEKGGITRFYIKDAE